MNEHPDFSQRELLGRMYVTERDRVQAPNDGVPRLLSVCFEPTNECPGRCPYCLIENHAPNEESETLLRVLDRLLDHGTLRFGFGGGEPLLRSDIYQLGAHVRARGAGALLRTSGMFRIPVRSALDAFDWVDISFDSVDPDVFRRCRPGVPHDVLMENVKSLSAAGVRVRVSILLTKTNLATVQPTVRWLASVPVSELRFQRLVPRGRARFSFPRLAPAPTAEDLAMESALVTAGSLGVRAFELGTISKTTLCIVKANGELFAAHPEGTQHRGSVFDDGALRRVAAELFARQSASYAEAGPFT